MNRRRILAIVAGLGLVATPAWLEARADAQARAALSRCGADGCPSIDTIDIDVDGLWISSLARQVGRRQVRAEGVRVSLGWSGVDVDVERLTVVGPPPPPAAAADPADPAPPEPSSATPSARPIPGPRGVPIRVRVAAPVEVDGPAGSMLRAEDLRIELDGAGGLEVRTRAKGSHHRIGTFVAEVQARARGDLRRWGVDATVHDAAGSEGLKVQAEVSPSSPRATLITPAGGRATLSTTDDGTGLVAELSSFDLAAVGDMLAALPRRQALDLDDAVLDGRIETTRRLDQVHLRGLTVRGLRVTHRKLARRPIDVDGLRIDGDAGRTADGGFAQLWLSRGDASVHLAGALSAATIAVELQVPPTDCQALVRAFPAAMRDALDGLEVRGELEGRIRLRLDRATLTRARASYGGELGEIPPRPGELELALPWQTACEVVADPVTIDLEGLAGPFRHRFQAGDGPRTRVMAPGAEGYVPLSSARVIADAFVTLEDSRFFDHDGFDREQIDNALWHNLLRGAIHRGASTISQQTARNLWLGVDRSAARKLQEALLTTRLESAVDKDRILELYINAIELGPGMFGVEPTAQHYFGKSAAQLSIREAVFVASLAPAPARLAERFADGEVDREWEDWIDRQLGRMYLARRITRDGRDVALRQRTRLRLGSHPGK